jgi:predicted NUDIX family phosphoesterase
MVLWEGKPYNSRVFVTHRVSAGDQRLRNKYSLGTGGHIRQPENIKSGAVREIMEEVGRDITNDDVAFIGTILSDATEVDMVHMGLVYMVYNAETGLPSDLKCLEDELEGEWMTVEEVGKLYDNLESWSQFVYDFIKQG